MADATHEQLPSQQKRAVSGIDADTHRRKRRLLTA